MKNIQIKHISISNFKGIKHFDTDFGSKTVILGANATGKTTVADAFFWTLFGKDSEDQKQFSVRPINALGEEIVGTSDQSHGPEPVVEIKLDIDGKETVLRKELREHWVKQAGHATKERTADQTKYFIDEVPKKKKEFDAKVGTIIDGNIFKLITNPGEFTSMNWQDQRKLLTQVAGSLTDDEVIASSDRLDGIKEIIGKSSADDARARLKASRHNLQKDIDSLPARIDEAIRAVPDKPELSKDELKSKINTTSSRIDSLHQQFSQDQRTPDDLKRQQQIADLNTQLIQKQAEYSDKQNAKLDEAQSNTDIFVKKLRKASDDLADMNSSFQAVNEKLNFLKSQKGKLLDQYNAIRESRQKVGDTCPVCGQPLDDKHKSQADNNLNVGLAKQLMDIKKRGEKTNAEIIATESKIPSLQGTIEGQQKAVDEAQKELVDAEHQRDLIRKSMTNFSDTELSKDIQKQIAELRSAETPIKDNSGIQDKLIDAKRELSSYQNALVSYDTIESQNERVGELKASEANQKDALDEIESQLAQLDDFTRTKVDLLESKINNQFDIVDFKLFDQLKNGGLQETCKMTVEGVPYQDLNSAARTNGGLDIIRTLQNFFQVQAPIVIDNAESINEILDTGAQEIMLVVSEDKELKVENK